MNKKATHIILIIAKNDPQGMSKSSYRALKRKYNSGLLAREQPKSTLSKRQIRIDIFLGNNGIIKSRPTLRKVEKKLARKD